MSQGVWRSDFFLLSHIDSRMEGGGAHDPGGGKRRKDSCVFHERTFRLYPVLPDFIDEKGAKSDEFMDFFVFSEGFFQKNRKDDLTSGGSVIY